MGGLSPFWIFNLFHIHFISDIILTIGIAIVFAPIFIVNYAVIQSFRRCWIRFIKWKYPNHIIVEKNSIESILDNGKNQGICTLLVQGGKILDEELRSHLNYLVSKKTALGSKLSSKYGLYAWRYHDDFSLDNHLIDAPTFFRGRPLTDTNIQEYVSEVTSKFLPLGLPPWQIHLISCSSKGEESQIYLVRAHHLLLRQEHLTLADFLPLQYSSDTWNSQESESPFINLYAKPSALPKLHQKLTESFSNNWNEFLCNNDPMERPEILKNHIGLFQCCKIGIIVLVATCKISKRNDARKIKSRASILHCEAQKRNFNLSTIWQALWKSLDPIQNVTSIIHWLWYFTIISTIKSPILVYRELRALHSRQKHCYPDTLTSVLSCYLPLIFQSLLEVWSILQIVSGAARSILNEMFSKNVQSNQLQTISPCGRKVIAWSDQVDLDILHRISSVTGASHVDILLTAIVDSLKVYFKQSGQIIPRQVLATARYVNHRSLFIKNREVQGILCLSLPTRTPHFDNDLVEILEVIKKNVVEARGKQKAIYAITSRENFRQILTSFLPSILIKIILNHLTRRYSLSLTHVDGDLRIDGVETAVYWSPPQGNCNLSITLHRYGTGFRLGVMGDALMSPQHATITRTFPTSVEKLARTLGVSAPSSRTSSPGPLSPTTSPGH
ncbi:uncharacterized protein [Fopius arisanus]|uniref:O-acyltransferase WSD1 C-terminal domain-containing protein n=1 Tax=Fopius arisanus TaxID=64838 RepID=A0A9R1T1W9_9HYME|nr:PREDICTED: uncharacterized protein LOC105265523 [Fopius arisanus]